MNDTRRRFTEIWFIVIVWLKFSLIQETCGSSGLNFYLKREKPLSSEKKRHLKKQKKKIKQKMKVEATKKLLDEETKVAIVDAEVKASEKNRVGQ